MTPPSRRPRTPRPSAPALRDLAPPVVTLLLALAVLVQLSWAYLAVTDADRLHPRDVPAVVAAGDFSTFQVIALVMAMSAGSVGFAHVNDSGFWLVSRFFGMDMKQTLATWTLIQGAMAIVGFTLSYILYGVASAIG